MQSSRPQNPALSFMARCLVVACALLCHAAAGWAQSKPPTAVLFENVRVFNGTEKLSSPMNVLVMDNKIVKISPGAIAAPEDTTVTKIKGGGRTLIPGLIDAHVHMMFSSLPQMAVLTSDIEFVTLASGRAATEMLMRGYTSLLSH